MRFVGILWSRRMAKLRRADQCAREQVLARCMEIKTGFIRISVDEKSAGVVG